MNAMTQAPIFSKGRDPDAAVAALRPWLAARLEAADVDVEPPEYPRGAGFSNETMLVRANTDAGLHEFAVRVEPAPENQVHFDPKFHLQHDIIRALEQHSTVRVPQALWYESDPGVLGRPFYVMRRMHGRVPVSMPGYNSTGWLADATMDQRRTAWESAITQLAAIHRVPAEDVSFVSRPEHGAPGDEQQLGYWRAHMHWALGHDIPDAVLALLDWLEEHRPQTSRPGLSWGDARIGNIMFGNDFRVVGVMDWEQVSLAGPVADLAWWLLFDEALSTGQGVPRLPGLGSRDETIALWQELTGRTSDDLVWHEVFARFKAGLLSLRSRRAIRRPTVAGTRRFSYIDEGCKLAGLPHREDD